MRTKLLINLLIVALIGAGCAESDTFSDGLLPVDTTSYRAGDNGCRNPKPDGHGV